MKLALVCTGEKVHRRERALTDHKFSESSYYLRSEMAKPSHRKTKGPKESGPSSPLVIHQKAYRAPDRKNPFLFSPIYDLLQVFGRAQDQWAARYIIILGVLLLKAAVGLGPFSGKGEKPINGDFEAQRHWMEITTHLPIREWYYFDLPYWGLDYPPLTAYHLWIFGKVGSFINSTWFQLNKSRGMETPQLKTFMRFTSLASELVIYIPAVMQLTSLLGGRKENLGRIHQLIVITLILCQPALVLIDNGHFQYNSVMLGLFLFSVIELIKGNLVLASIWFMSSIFFKQMALYYSPFIFFFILSKLFTPKKTTFETALSFKVAKLLLVGITVTLTTAVIFVPFIVASNNAKEAYGLAAQVLVRMFPFGRGLFEDKVANFWCTTNVLVKYASRFAPQELKLLSFALTLLSILPPCLMCFWKSVTRAITPPELIIYGFSATAWGFFLFLFQVHEKTVLVPLIPSTFLLLTSNPDIISIIQWISNVSTFSLYPLLKKDGLHLQYLVTFLLINWLISGLKFKIKNNLLWPGSQSLVFKGVVVLSYVAIAVIHLLDLFVEAPQHLPDLWVLANTSASFGCFAWFYLWLLYRIYQS